MKRGTRWRKQDPRGRGSAISDLTAQRLSVYLRCLDDLQRKGARTVSSQALADRLHLNSAQIRKDLACFGEFGIRGIGYLVDDLRRNLTRILGLTRDRGVIIVGAGNLGMALADYGGFNREGFRIVALFDRDRRKIGAVSRGGVPVVDVRRLPAVARREHVSIAVLAVPADAAQRAFDLAAQAGIKAVLNFAPARIKTRPGVTIKGVDLKIQLENLSFHLARSEEA